MFGLILHGNILASALAWIALCGLCRNLTWFCMATASLRVSWAAWWDTLYQELLTIRQSGRSFTTLRQTRSLLWLVCLQFTPHHASRCILEFLGSTVGHPLPRAAKNPSVWSQFYNSETDKIFAVAGMPLPYLAWSSILHKFTHQFKVMPRICALLLFSDRCMSCC